MFEDEWEYCCLDCGGEGYEEKLSCGCTGYRMRLPCKGCNSKGVVDMKTFKIQEKKHRDIWEKFL